MTGYVLHGNIPGMIMYDLCHCQVIMNGDYFGSTKIANCDKDFDVDMSIRPSQAVQLGFEAYIGFCNCGIGSMILERNVQLVT